MWLALTLCLQGLFACFGDVLSQSPINDADDLYGKTLVSLVQLKRQQLTANDGIFVLSFRRNFPVDDLKVRYRDSGIDNIVQFLDADINPGSDGLEEIILMDPFDGASPFDIEKEVHFVSKSMGVEIVYMIQTLQSHVPEGLFDELPGIVTEPAGDIVYTGVDQAARFSVAAPRPSDLTGNTDLYVSGVLVSRVTGKPHLKLQGSIALTSFLGGAFGTDYVVKRGEIPVQSLTDESYSNGFVVVNYEKHIDAFSNSLANKALVNKYVISQLKVVRPFSQPDAFPRRYIGFIDNLPWYQESDTDGHKEIQCGSQTLCDAYCTAAGNHNPNVFVWKKSMQSGRERWTRFNSTDVSEFFDVANNNFLTWTRFSAIVGLEDAQEFRCDAINNLRGDMTSIYIRLKFDSFGFEDEFINLIN